MPSCKRRRIYKIYVAYAWLHLLTCPKPIGCCCWGWNAGVIFCGLLRRGVEWWCCRPGMPRPLDWHEDSKAEVGGQVKGQGWKNTGRWRWHRLMQVLWCFTISQCNSQVKKKAQPEISSNYKCRTEIYVRRLCRLVSDFSCADQLQTFKYSLICPLNMI